MLTGSWTQIMVWKLSSLSSEQTLQYWPDMYERTKITSDGKVRQESYLSGNYENNYSNAGDISADTFVVIGLTKSGTTRKIYVNGVIKNTKTGAQTGVANGSGVSYYPTSNNILDTNTWFSRVFDADEMLQVSNALRKVLS